jgi:hypothetical protein
MPRGTSTNFICFPQTLEAHNFLIQFEVKQASLERYGRDLRNGVIIIAI